MHHRGSSSGRILALAIALCALVAAQCEERPPAPRPGLPEFQGAALVAVPGGLVNAMGNNLIVRRVDLSIDTRIGTHEVGATYNGASGAWLWTFDIRYDGARFVDYSGAAYDTSALAPGAAIPGTWWVKLDATTLKTKGGLVHEFGADGRLRAVRWASAAWPRIQLISQSVAGLPRTTAIDQCTDPGTCSRVFTIAYDAAGRVVSLGDRAGRRAEFAYDAAGRLASARDGLDTARGWPGFRYEYAQGWLAAITSSEGERVEYARGDGTLRVRQVGAESPEHRFRSLGKANGLFRTEHLDPLGGRVVYRYDAERRLHEVENAAGGELTRLRWEGKRIVEWIRPDGTSFRWTYRDDDRASELQPSGNELRFLYEPDGVDRVQPLARPLLRVDDTLGLVQQRTYDGAGRLVAVTNGAGETSAFTWGPDEALASVTSPAGVATRFSGYGDHGHPTRVGVDGTTHRRRYDAVGNLVARGDAEVELGGVVSRFWDEDRNLAQLVLAGQSGFQQLPEETLRIEHRSDGRRARILRPGGGEVQLVYDAIGRQVERREKVDGAWQGTRFERDARGRVTAVERSNGMREETRYDAAGRVSARSVGWGHPIALESTARFTHRQGRLVEVRDSLHAGPESLAYDGAGRVAAVSYPDGEILTLDYDLRSRLTRVNLTVPEAGFARSFEFAYDGADRERSVRDGSEEILHRVWALGRLAETRYGNGLTRTFSYDAGRGRLAGTTSVDGSGLTLETSAVRSDCPPLLGLGGCLEASTRTFGGAAASSVETYYLGPDDEYSAPIPGLVGLRVTAFGLEDAFDYDALSNVGDASSDARTLAFVYDAERSRLARIEDDQGALLHEYRYDSAGFAIERDGVPLRWDGAGRIAGIGSQVSFTWDTLGRLVSSTAAGVRVRRRFGGLVEADVLGHPLAIDLGEVRIDLVAGERNYRHFDFRGNVKFVSDDRGVVVTHYRYTAYGVDRVIGSAEDGVRFARGRELGELVLLGHRVYDPAAARFLAPDPVPQLVNAYAYTLGNPVWYWDPSGREGTLNGLTAGGWAAAAAFVSAVAVVAQNAPVAAAFGLLSATFLVIDQAGGFPWEGDKQTLREVIDYFTRAEASSDPGAVPEFPGADLALALDVAMGAIGTVAAPAFALPGVEAPSGPCAPVRLDAPALSVRALALVGALNLLLALEVARRVRGRRKAGAASAGPPG